MGTQGIETALTMRIRCLALCLCVSMVQLFFSAPAHAADKRTQRQAQLKDVRSKIETTQKKLARNEEAHDAVRAQIRALDASIAASGKRLQDFAAQRRGVQAELQQLEQQTQALTQQTAMQQAQLARLLYQQNLRGDNEALRLLLSGEDPNQRARDGYFLAMLSHGKAELIDQLKSAQLEKQKLAAAAAEKNAKLAAIQQQQQEAQKTLLAQQQQRQELLARIGNRIEQQKRELAALKRDEQRLGTLIERLTRQASRPAKKPRERTRSAEHKPPANETALNNEREPEAGLKGAFAALRGKLRLPVKGEIANRFGTPRAEGGAKWKGIYIRAAEGAEVKAVAAGRIAFADTLRGFGNLIIVDHGDGFFTIYGNNQSLTRQNGDKVSAGEVIARAGNSSGSAESGLYFELRHQAQALDPLQWVSLR